MKVNSLFEAVDKKEIAKEIDRLESNLQILLHKSVDLEDEVVTLDHLEIKKGTQHGNLTLVAKITASNGDVLTFDFFANAHPDARVPDSVTVYSQFSELVRAGHTVHGGAISSRFIDAGWESRFHKKNYWPGVIDRYKKLDKQWVNAVRTNVRAKQQEKKKSAELLKKMHADPNALTVPAVKDEVAPFDKHVKNFQRFASEALAKTLTDEQHNARLDKLIADLQKMKK